MVVCTVKHAPLYTSKSKYRVLCTNDVLTGVPRGLSRACAAAAGVLAGIAAAIQNSSINIAPVSYPTASTTVLT